MSWTAERVELLEQLWRSGRSASQIAQALGGVTRNAVIGKAHRLGLMGRPSPIRDGQPVERPVRVATPRAAAPKPAPRPPVVRAVEPAPLPPVAELAGDSSATILTLTERMCKWPIGDPRDEDFHFCGGGTVPGRPYCEHHARRAYQVPTRRGDEERKAG
jgi:GcrA cell cycle regulator